MGVVESSSPGNNIKRPRRLLAGALWLPSVSSNGNKSHPLLSLSHLLLFPSLMLIPSLHITLSLSFCSTISDRASRATSRQSPTVIPGAGGGGGGGGFDGKDEQTILCGIKDAVLGETLTLFIRAHPGEAPRSVVFAPSCPLPCLPLFSSEGITL